MKKIILFFILITGNIFAEGNLLENVGFGLGLGLGGYEAKGIYRFNQYFSSSLEYNNFELENVNVDSLGSGSGDVSASGTLKISAIKALFHFHPLANGFRVSAGYTYNLSDISIDIEGTDVDLGGVATSDINGSITIDTGSTLPYIGVGFGYSYEDFISFDFSVGIQFLPKIKGEDLLKSDVTMSSSALTTYINNIDGDILSDYPEIASVVSTGDPFDLYNTIENLGTITTAGGSFSVSDFGDVPNPNDYIGDIQDQIDDLVEQSGLGIVQDILGYAPLPVFSVGFTIFF